ncbi:MAG: hypothetical protein K8T20_16610 [Planctomycetes bacterium]|nr:hypothetical protein [Planctomycetota bacterium]
MTVPGPEPRAVTVPTVPRGLKRAIGCVIAVGLFVAIARILHLAATEQERRGEILLGQLRLEHGGKIAWLDEDDQVGWSSLAEIGTPGAVHTVKVSGSPLRVAWSSSGQQLYVVVEGGASGDVDSIVAVDIVSGTSRVLLDLGIQKLEDIELDPDEFWVAPVGDAEAEFDRIYFRVGGTAWHSVEGRNGKVRPEAGPPAKKWNQAMCPDGKHVLASASSEDDGWLEITDGTERVKVTPGSASEPGAWWCER